MSYIVKCLPNEKNIYKRSKEKKKEKKTDVCVCVLSTTRWVFWENMSIKTHKTLMGELKKNYWKQWLVPVNKRQRSLHTFMKLQRMKVEVEMLLISFWFHLSNNNFRCERNRPRYVYNINNLVHLSTCMLNNRGVVHTHTHTEAPMMTEYNQKNSGTQNIPTMKLWSSSQRLTARIQKLVGWTYTNGDKIYIWVKAFISKGFSET